MRNNKNKNNDYPQEVLELLPWHAIGKLSTNDQILFDQALLKFPSIEKLINQEQQLIERVSADESVLDKSAISSQNERLKSVFNIIDNPEKQRHVIQPSQSLNIKTSLLDKFKEVLNSLIPEWHNESQYTHVLGAGLLILTIGFTANHITSSSVDTSDFIPASAASTDSEIISTTLLLVGFNGTSAQLSDNPVLKDKLIKVETTPERPGIYQVIFKKTLSKAEIKQTIDALQKQDELVWFAGESF